MESFGLNTVGGRLAGHLPQKAAMKFDYNKNRFWAENLHVVTQIGLTMAGCIVFCFWIGYLIDGWIGTRGVFVTVFTILGIVGGANVVYRQIMEIMVPEEQDSRPDEKDGEK